MSTLILAGTIFAGDPPRPGPTAIVVEDGRIEWLGAPALVPHRYRSEPVDLTHAVLIPGLIDSHQHMLQAAATLGWADCSRARSPEEAVARLREHSRTVRETWIVGWGYDAGRANGGRRPTRALLDSVSEERPILLVESSFHQGIANSAALAAVGFGRSTPRRWGGELERDRRGEPTGVVWERAFSVLERAALRAEEEAADGLRGRADEVCRHHLMQGVTHVGEAVTPPRNLEWLLSADLPIGFTHFPTSEHGTFATPRDALEGPRTGEGSTMAGVGPLKLFADGAERCAVRIPLSRLPRQTWTAVRRMLTKRDPGGLRILSSTGTRLKGNAVFSGTLHYPPGGLTDIMSAGLERGFRIAVHALGNEGFRVAVESYEEARARTGVDVAGCRVEHAMFAEQSDLERAARLGLILSMQPGHAVHYSALRVTAADVVFDPVPLRTAIDAGCAVAISSDAPTAPATALENMRAAVNRMAADGTPVRPDLAITPEEALRAATIAGAEACGVADVKGSLDVGKQADFAVLSGDPFDERTTVLETWVVGERRWPDGRASPAVTE
ncbi:MAG: amidohydrolase family protein [Actinomycetota bacterium]|nr:amidohydrolase family protein [Actinomycetota bacterium]